MNTVSNRQELLEQGIDLGSIRADLGSDAVATLGDAGTTGAGTFRPERWHVYTADGGGYEYQIASGDTLSALAALYLNHSARWPEIWNIQHASRRDGGSPDEIYADEWFYMPEEAGLNARAMNGGTLPGTPGGSTPGPGPGPGPGPEPATTTKSIPTGVYVAGGALLLGVLVWLAVK